MKQWAIVMIGGTLLLSPIAGFCSLDFYSYQMNITGQTADTVQTEDTVLNAVDVGGSQLETSEITITPKGSYIDVVEDAWISGEFTQTYYDDLIDLYFFQGSISLPPRSVIGGLMIWNNTTAYQAELYPAVYSNQTVYPDSQMIAAGSKNDVCSVTQLSSTDYQVKITNVALGETKHVRIRYLMANSGPGTAQYRVPVLFDEGGQNPAYIKLTVNATNAQKYILSGNLPSLTLSDTSTNMIPYQNSFVLTGDTAQASVVQLTTFASGAWKGNYLLLNTLIPDTVIGELSQPMETIFLWRWNSPQTFTQTANQSRVLSVYGQAAVSEAQSIGQVVSLLTSRGQKAGLVHSVQNKAPKVFPLSSKNDTQFVRLQAYLAQFNPTYFLTGANAGDYTRPDWAPQQVQASTATDSSRQELLHGISLSVGLYSSNNGVLHHLIIVSAGPIKDASISVTKADLDSLLKNTTCDAGSAQWQGVDFSQAIPSAQTQNLEYYAGYFFPAFEPKSVSLRINHGTENYTFPLAPESNNTLALSAKSQAPWDTLFEWTGYNGNGQKTASAVSLPSINRVILDSGTVKIWAGDPNRLSDDQEENIGGVYGIITKAFGMRASTKDTVSSPGKSIAYLTNGQITMPLAVAKNPVSAMDLPSRFSFHMVDGYLILNLPVVGNHCTLTIVDMAGRCLLKIKIAGFGAGGRYRVPVKQLLADRFSRLFCARIEGDNFQKNFILFQGDRL
ncbi:MAG: hypothetical protein WBM07_11185 [Chitinivibrionales bacterium]